jgi:hypothetical protein
MPSAPCFEGRSFRGDPTPFICVAILHPVDKGKLVNFAQC